MFSNKEKYIPQRARVTQKRKTRWMIALTIIFLLISVIVAFLNWGPADYTAPVLGVLRELLI